MTVAPRVCCLQARPVDLALSVDRVGVGRAMRISCCARCVNVRVGGFPVVSIVRCVAWLIAAGAGLLALAAGPAAADTLKWALTQAYQNNPLLNSQRASVRATDETV